MNSKHKIFNDTMSVEEACSYIQVCSQTIYNLISQGKLDSIKFGRIRLIKKTSLDSYVQGEIEKTHHNE